MSPDYKGLRILKSFLTAINLKDLSNIDKECLLNESKSINIGSNENKLSCKMCDVDFNTLDEFKLHRRSSDHLNKLNESFYDSTQNNCDDFEVDNCDVVKGSPFFEIHYCNYKLQCFKIILANRKEDLYSQSTLSLDINLYNKLQNIYSSHFMVSLNGGGYFAAAIFDNSSQQLVCSKIIRKYTTRRKQGGSQSLKDNESSGKIHSAGAMIRRENEKKLRDEILSLISVWKPSLAKCSIVFCNRDLFLTQEVFKDYDVRTLPFTTYQASFEEICRCYTELISSINFLE